MMNRELLRQAESVAADESVLLGNDVRNLMRNLVSEVRKLNGVIEAASTLVSDRWHDAIGGYDNARLFAEKIQGTLLGGGR